MAEPLRLAIAILAAGSSRRFGEADKLTADFDGRPLGEHVAAAVPAERFEDRWVITSDPNHLCSTAWTAAGFELVHNNRASRGMGTSVAMAARFAASRKCHGLMIALADMPRVPTSHFTALVDALNGPGDIAASSNTGSKVGVRLPPAIFGGDHLGRLSRMRGEEGARRMLAEARTIPCPADWLIDIDRPDDLRKYGQPSVTTLKPEPSPKPAPNGE